MKGYIDALQYIGEEPTFYCSDEYFEKAGWEDRNEHNIYRVTDPSDGMYMLPPLFVTYDQDKGFVSPIVVYDIWCDLEGYKADNAKRFFLDYEYIYDPSHFFPMEGGKWATFRKNVAKFPKRLDVPFYYIPVVGNEFDKQIKMVFWKWLGNRSEEEVIQDDRVMLKYLLNGEHREVLVDRNNKLYGVNIWDENWKYINFRYCFCLPGMFLSEFMRYLFYERIYKRAINKGKKPKLVNDGGVLGNESLKAFKDKLNPKEVRKRYSWRLKR